MYYDENNNYFEYNNEINKEYLDIDNSKNYDMYNEIKFNNANINYNDFRNTNLFSPEEGLNKGNIFKDLYSPYKNYIYKVVVKGKREELLLKIQQLTFVLKDLNLYLDLYPQNTKMLNIFKFYSNELKKLKDLYNKEYFALCVSDVSKNYFDWISSPWPWDNKGGNSYV